MHKLIGRCKKIERDNELRFEVEVKRKQFIIRYPQKFSEFEVHSYLLWGLRFRGYDARGEVHSKNRDSRFDIVIFEKKEPCLIIEVKAKVTGKGNVLSMNMQLSKYHRYQLKVKTIYGMIEAQEYLHRQRFRHHSEINYVMQGLDPRE